MVLYLQLGTKFLIYQYSTTLKRVYDMFLIGISIKEKQVGKTVLKRERIKKLSVFNYNSFKFQTALSLFGCFP